MTKGIVKLDDHPKYGSNTHQYFAVHFHGKSILTHVTRDPDVVTRWLSTIKRIHYRRLYKLVVGLDVEWRPNTDRHHNNPIATLQLCVGRRCLIYQLIHTPEIPDSLIRFLKHKNNTFVGVGVGGDLERLEEDYGLGEEAKRVDLRYLAARNFQRSDLIGSGLKGLSSLVLEKDLEKPREVTLSGWDHRWLSYRQIQYAAVDAFASFEIGRVLRAWK